MTVRAPRQVVAHVRLDASQAAALWTWLLGRQGLSAHTRLDMVRDVAEASLGLHAARRASPYATLLPRLRDPAAAQALFDPAAMSDLVTIRCMRKTLHVLPVGLAAAAHTATRHYRERDALRLIHNAGLAPLAIEAALRRTEEILDDGPLRASVLVSALLDTASGGTQGREHVLTARLAIKLGWERGALTYLNTSPTWDREDRVFALTRRHCPLLLEVPDQDVAARELIGAYFDRYGPATLTDAMWWSALSARAITQAMEAWSRWVEVITPWAGEPGYMPEHRWEQWTAEQRDQPATGDGDGKRVHVPAGAAPTETATVHLLAHEDVALKAYQQTRDRYLAGLPHSSAFNAIGEALPTVILNGQVIGTWRWNRATGRVGVTLDPQRRPAWHDRHVRDAIRQQALAAGRALRQASDAFAGSKPKTAVRVSANQAPNLATGSPACRITHLPSAPGPSRDSPLPPTPTPSSLPSHRPEPAHAGSPSPGASHDAAVEA